MSASYGVADEKTHLDDHVSIHSEDEYTEVDPFVPFPLEDGQREEKHILTVRAVIVGCLLGGLVNASNIYLGLKTGWTFSANLFGAIFGFAIIKFFSRVLPEAFPILGGKEFGPKEGSIIQTSATAAGGLSGIFCAAIPALYQLNLLGDSPSKDLPRLLSFTVVSAYYGLFFATPLRKFFIVHVARELNLVFPTATATAMTIRSMHAVTDGSHGANKRVKALVIAFILAFVLRVTSSYAPGILWDWHIFTWIFQWGNYKNAAIMAENWGWMIEWTPAFIGSGMLVGLNPALSFMGGSILAWGIIGPILVHMGFASGFPIMPENELWKGWMNYNSFSLPDPKNNPSPRYWLLWPGVMVMICASFTELAIQYKLIWFAIKSAFKAMASGTNEIIRWFGSNSPWLERKARFTDEDNMIEDPAPESEQVKMWMWLPGTLVVVVATVIILTLQYHMHIGMVLLSIILGFLFAFVAIQCTGATDVTPLTTAAKGAQLVIGGVGQGLRYEQTIAQRMNLIAGAIASGAASQSTDLTVDFRVGFLLRTPPILQWTAQAIGSFFSIFISVGVFILFSRAYPCILEADAEFCSFRAPSATAWRAVTVAVTEPSFPIPPSSAIFSLCFGGMSIASVLIRHYVLVGERLWFRAYMPNFMAMGLAFCLPQTIYSTAMVMGATAAYIWAKKNGRSFDVYCYAIAAGLIAGEGMGGVVNAVLQIAGVSGDHYGSYIGCPGDQACR